LSGIMRIVVRIDEKGRVLIPKRVREEAKVGPGDLVAIHLEEGRICLQPLKSVADELYGAYKVEKWPEDLDEFLVEAVRQWWRGRGT